MEKTAMQELRDKLQDVVNYVEGMYLDRKTNAYNDGYKEAMIGVIKDIEDRLLAKEREQIVEARMMDETCSLNSAEQYYSSKYEQK